MLLRACIVALTARRRGAVVVGQRVPLDRRVALQRAVEQRGGFGVELEVLGKLADLGHLVRLRSHQRQLTVEALRCQPLLEDGEQRLPHRLVVHRATYVGDKQHAVGIGQVLLDHGVARAVVVTHARRIDKNHAARQAFPRSLEDRLAHDRPPRRAAQVVGGVDEGAYQRLELRARLCEEGARGAQRLLHFCRDGAQLEPVDILGRLGRGPATLPLALGLCCLDRLTHQALLFLPLLAGDEFNFPPVRRHIVPVVEAQLDDGSRACAKAIGREDALLTEHRVQAGRLACAGVPEHHNARIGSLACTCVPGAPVRRQPAARMHPRCLRRAREDVSLLRNERRGVLSLDACLLLDFAHPQRAERDRVAALLLQRLDHCQHAPPHARLTAVCSAPREPSARPAHRRPVIQLLLEGAAELPQRGVARGRHCRHC
mmetsp:Transcript_8047/g.24754  ORF Transcript_8047/g.24754 Transcript_8047/m.24754 type:complete len:430 (-) Transcript_8047:146-1435(-)